MIQMPRNDWESLPGGLRLSCATKIHTPIAEPSETSRKLDPTAKRVLRLRCLAGLCISPPAKPKAAAFSHQRTATLSSSRTRVDLFSEGFNTLKASPTTEEEETGCPIQTQ